MERGRKMESRSELSPFFAVHIEFQRRNLGNSMRRWFQPSVQRKASLGGRLAMPINQRLSAVCDKLAIVAKANVYGIRTVPERRSVTND